MNDPAPGTATEMPVLSASKPANRIGPSMIRLPYG